MGLPPTTATFAEYAALDEVSDERLEYVSGQVLASGGASPRHNRIVGNAFAALDRALRGGPCVPLAGAQRVYGERTDIAAYPDVVVLCGPARYLPDGRTLLNPSLLVEVLSPTTQDYDRGAKFRHYMRIASFVEYLVISSERLHVEHHRRTEPGEWLMREHTTPEARVDVLGGAVIVVADLYDRTDELG